MPLFIYRHFNRKCPNITSSLQQKKPYYVINFKKIMKIFDLNQKCSGNLIFKPWGVGKGVELERGEFFFYNYLYHLLFINGASSWFNKPPPSKSEAIFCHINDFCFCFNALKTFP